MGTTDLTLKSIKDLMVFKFSIPDYQRGYRWDDRQVQELLDDIFEFHRNCLADVKNVGEFYCLQPIVVMRNDDRNTWEVIDGQQRLTTLYIILYCQVTLVKAIANDIFELEYDTRPNSKDFLNNIATYIDNKEKCKEYVDYYHISNAYITIKNWFKANSNNINIVEFLNTLLNKVKFIWYEVSKGNEKPQIIFSRINLGKIKLTSAELVKALFFLQKNASHEYQAKIGIEWDNIENTLQNPSFWYFITGSKPGQSNHISLILDLIASNYNTPKYIKGNEIDSKHDEYWMFYVFYDLITNDSLKPESKGLTTKEYLWDLIKSYFRIFDEWFNDNNYYHLTGFLFNMGEKIENIILLFNTSGKSQFLDKLQERIRSCLSIEENDLDSLLYTDNKQKAKISDILLLFNIISSIKSGYIRFPFEQYTNEEWSLEHIHAQNSETFKKKEERRVLLEAQKNYFLNKNAIVQSKIIALLSCTNIEKEPFDVLEKEIFNLFTDADASDDILHSIKNLALLPKDINSSLSNYLFPVKKDKIKEHDENGHFIPICTKNVFMKYYSGNVEQNVKWDIADMDAYLIQIKKVLKDYFIEDDDAEEAE